MSWSNYDDVLSQLRSAGLLFRTPIDHDRPRSTRCKVEGADNEKRGWYWLKTWVNRQGESLLVGSYGVFQGNDSNARKVELPKGDDGKRMALSKEEAAAFRKMLADAQKKADAELARTAARAARKAQAAWNRLDATAVSPYLDNKGVSAHGLRFTKNATAVVPMHDARGHLHGLQFLRPGEVTGPNGKKRPPKEFWPAGLAKKGHFHLIGMPRDVLLIGEGYATLASAHEAATLPAAVAFDANNLGPVSLALHKRYPQARILFLADDDSLGKCRHADCRARVALFLHPTDCPQCERAHGYVNTGITAANTAALAVNGQVMAPAFADEEARARAYLETGAKPTDFNDLHAIEGLPRVRQQIEAKLRAVGWLASKAAPVIPPKGAGEADGKLRPITTTAELLERFALIYAGGGLVFDRQERIQVALSDMRDACVHKEIHRAWQESPDREIVRTENVGFDPAGEDPNITCNLWGGWPTTPQAGHCERLLDLLRYLCSAEGPNAARLFDWVLKWLAYPIQNPGAKMKTALVVHGPQGTGKNLFFEAIMAIYGKYGRIIGQSAIEDKHNEWASRRLFLIADEVVARADMYHIKNELKGLITGDWIRINHKFMRAYEERNHCNLVFLSNEAMPVVIEEDDRRHCVIWTPPLKDPGYYARVLAEIDAGGIAALHDYLAHLPLEDFHPGSKPPMTQAKDELINLGLDHPVAFWDAYLRGDTVPQAEDGTDIGLAETWYTLYRAWCSKNGHRSPVTMVKFSNQLQRKRGVQSVRKWYWVGQKAKQATVFLPGPAAAPPGEVERDWITRHIEAFANKARDYCAGLGNSGQRGHGQEDAFE